MVHHVQAPLQFHTDCTLTHNNHIPTCLESAVDFAIPFPCILAAITYYTHTHTRPHSGRQVESRVAGKAWEDGTLLTILLLRNTAASEGWGMPSEREVMMELDGARVVLLKVVGRTPCVAIVSPKLGKREVTKLGCRRSICNLSNTIWVADWWWEERVWWAGHFYVFFFSPNIWVESVRSF